MLSDRWTVRRWNRLKNYDAELTAVATSKVPSGAYRGFGKTQAAFVMERMVDHLAREN